MKIKIEVDCTPEEARRFFGLPEVAPMQERLLADAEERLRTFVKDVDPKSLAEFWLPSAVGGFDKLMNIWSHYGTNKRSPKVDE